ncbi:hypothetical protein TW74_04670 [Vibrio nigripulchritudo]|nr:hypothetical protein TW74_04670 [Vibrio nigripulchritudo]
MRNTSRGNKPSSNLIWIYIKIAAHTFGRSPPNHVLNFTMLPLEVKLSHVIKMQNLIHQKSTSILRMMMWKWSKN